MSKLTVDFTPAELAALTAVVKAVNEGDAVTVARLRRMTAFMNAVAKLDALEFAAEESATKMVRTDEPTTVAAAKSLIRQLAEADMHYRPFCLICDPLVRMTIQVPMLWLCEKCGAIRDERRTDKGGPNRV